MVAAWIQAGIFPVFAAGNAGQKGCSTVDETSTNPNVIGVGSLDQDNTISFFSSRGPSLKYNSIQPDVAAPGNQIISADRLVDNRYQTMSGTSMATPHVAGLVALLYSQKPDLTIKQIRILVLEGAQPIQSLRQACGGRPDNVYPNNHAGSGGINAVASINAIDRLPELEKPPPSSQEILVVYRIKAFVLLSLVLFSMKGIM
jgi:subtilisin family serine protease